MKKYLYLLLVLPFFISCSDDDSEETQDYTSFTLKGIETNIFTNSKIAYFNKEGKCILLMELGTLESFIETEEFILPEFHTEIYLFYGGGAQSEKIRRSFLYQREQKEYYNHCSGCKRCNNNRQERIHLPSLNYH